MELVKFRVCGEILMINKALLVSKSAYFAALLDGPLQSCENEDGTIDILERDVATLKELFFLIQRGAYSEMAIDNEAIYQLLEKMAAFYLVDLPNTHEELPAPLFIYESFSRIKPKDMFGLDLLISSFDSMKLTVFSDYAVPQGCAQLVKILLAGDIVSLYPVETISDVTGLEEYTIIIVTRHPLAEMGRRHLGFSIHFTELYE